MTIWILWLVTLGGATTEQEQAITHAFTTQAQCVAMGVDMRKHISEKGFIGVGFTCKQVELVFQDEGDKI